MEDDLKIKKIYFMHKAYNIPLGETKVGVNKARGCEIFQ